jgi:hypothetical protein
MRASCEARRSISWKPTGPCTASPWFFLLLVRRSCWDSLLAPLKGTDQIPWPGLDATAVPVGEKHCWTFVAMASFDVTDCRSRVYVCTAHGQSAVRLLVRPLVMLRRWVMEEHADAHREEYLPLRGMAAGSHARTPGGARAARRARGPSEGPAAPRCDGA